GKQTWLRVTLERLTALQSAARPRAELQAGTERGVSRLSGQTWRSPHSLAWGLARPHRGCFGRVRAQRCLSPQGHASRALPRGSAGKLCPENAARERSRVRTLRQAFLALQAALPSVPPDTKLSKLDVLVLATSYIAHLTHTLHQGQPPPEAAPLARAPNFLHPMKVTGRAPQHALGCPGSLARASHANGPCGPVSTLEPGARMLLTCLQLPPQPPVAG
uniref:Transcription factor 23 n=1 Tax=Chrysemys picta bellii TaxID=8478 RepID=A0A8C3I385_CHRPI